jgi:hypothetical protein
VGPGCRVDSTLLEFANSGYVARVVAFLMTWVSHRSLCAAYPMVVTVKHGCSGLGTRAGSGREPYLCACNILHA